jgi:hypothetical protein
MQVAGVDLRSVESIMITHIGFGLRESRESGIRRYYRVYDGIEQNISEPTFTPIAHHQISRS